MTPAATLLRLARTGRTLIACVLIGIEGRPYRLAYVLASRYLATGSCGSIDGIGLRRPPAPYPVQFERRAGPSAVRMALRDMPGVGS